VYLCSKEQEGGGASKESVPLPYLNKSVFNEEQNKPHTYSKNENYSEYIFLYPEYNF
jgi:hypothetical protein